MNEENTSFQKWAKENDIHKFLKQYKESKAAWNAAIEEAVMALYDGESEFPESLVAQVTILINGLKE